jgi:hypothetical protein
MNDAAEHLDRQEETGARRDPARATAGLSVSIFLALAIFLNLPSRFRIYQ